eukprot:CAMPEP_0204342018 /NCGR_PEP_ID=MMETSP0469-20131031/23813_1 /ASSEMBLY_ACC=CAM_ASM_000384 /TAXON_ID=2969 /ORGANISM="Oxyrrhis marina" /LENGTH=349 /DNA_ID=CAMNT_0051326845 /DNA_START=47 /DNA_END=1096 /DNA_ORIENTATION=-
MGKRDKKGDEEAPEPDDEGKMSTLKQEQEAKKRRKLQAEAGLISQGAAERLDWMYEANALDGEGLDEHLMNSAVKGDRDQDMEDVKKLSTEIAGSLFLKDVTRTSTDTFRKLREDPMFQIKQAEHRQKSELASNPLIMARIKEKRAREARKVKKAAKKEKKKAKKEKKKAKKEAKRAKKAGASSSSSSDSSDGEQAAAPQSRGPASAVTRRSRSRSPRGAVSPVREDLRAPGLGSRPSGPVGAPRVPRKGGSQVSRTMTAEEREAKIAAMRADGSRHEQAKDERIHKIGQYEQAVEQVEEKLRATKDSTFMNKVKKDTYMADGTKLADRLRTQRHRLETRNSLRDDKLV